MNQSKAAKQATATYSHIKTLAELEEYERERIDQIQINISDTSSYMKIPKEPIYPSDELERTAPRPETILLDPQQSDSFLRQRWQELCEFRARKDWANTKLFRTVILMSADLGGDLANEEQSNAIE